MPPQCEKNEEAERTRETQSSANNDCLSENGWAQYPRPAPKISEISP